MNISVPTLDEFYKLLRKEYRGKFIKASKGKSLTFGYRVDIVMRQIAYGYLSESLQNFCKDNGYEIYNLIPDNVVLVNDKVHESVTTFSIREDKFPVDKIIFIHVSYMSSGHYTFNFHRESGKNHLYDYISPRSLSRLTSILFGIPVHVHLYPYPSMAYDIEEVRRKENSHG